MSTPGESPEPSPDADEPPPRNDDPAADPAAPPEPEGPVPEPPERLPTTSWLRVDEIGALLELGGRGVRRNAVDVGVLWATLRHFEELVRAIRAYTVGYPEPQYGQRLEPAARLVAVPPALASFSLPLRVELAPAATYHDEMESVAALVEQLLEDGDVADLAASMPRPAKHALARLLQVTGSADVDISLMTYHGRSRTAAVHVPAAKARRLAQQLAPPDHPATNPSTNLSERQQTEDVVGHAGEPTSAV